MEMSNSARLFIELFEKYGFEVTPKEHNSFIADNGLYCVFATAYSFYGRSELMAVSFYSCCREEVNKLCRNSPIGIGAEVYNRISNNRLGVSHAGPLLNHDYSDYEIEGTIRSIYERMKQNEK